MTELEVMQRQQQLANDLWQQVISMDEFVAGMNKLKQTTSKAERITEPKDAPTQPRKHSITQRKLKWQTFADVQVL